MNIGIIPARYAATRLPGKPLIDLEGQSMIQRVYNSAKASAALDRVVIATDDARVVQEAHRIGAEVVITDPALPSGTDRCAAVVDILGVRPEIVVNIQGDEPLLMPQVVTDIVDAVRTTNADVATPVTVIKDPGVLLDPSTVKVAMSASGRAVYFSRSVIPYVRDVPILQWFDHQRFWKHIGLYAYTLDALRKHCSLPGSPLEKAESLEQLRMLESGAWFQCVETTQHFISVDTPEDAEAVRHWLRAQKKAST